MSVAEDMMVLIMATIIIANRQRSIQCPRTGSQESMERAMTAMGYDEPRFAYLDRPCLVVVTAVEPRSSLLGDRRSSMNHVHKRHSTRQDPCW